MKKLFQNLLLISLISFSNFALYGSENVKITEANKANGSDVVQNQAPANTGSSEKLKENQKPHISETYIDSWLYIKDSLLLAPGYASSFLFPAKVLSAVGGLTLLQSRDSITGNVELRSWPKAALKWTCERFEWLVGKDKGYSSFGGLGYAIMVLIAGVGSYKLSNYVIETIGYGYALNNFFLDYEKYNRVKTPEVLRSYMDKEYETYKKNGSRYIFTKTRKVINFVSMAVKMHEKQALDNK